MLRPSSAFAWNCSPADSLSLPALSALRLLSLLAFGVRAEDPSREHGMSAFER